MADKEKDQGDVSAEIQKNADDIEKLEKKKAAPKKKKADNDKIIKNTIDLKPTLDEAVSKTVVLGWGRMNPVTVGHEKLVNKLKDVARKNKATPLLYVTHSHDAKKNPLSYDDKVMIARKAFGNVIQKSNAKTIIQALQELQKKYSKLILVVGQDRIKEFDSLLNKYNGKDYTFDSIEIVSAGDRDPDADDVTGMSASKMRALASKGDKVAFTKGLPSKVKDDAEDIYDMVRAGMKLSEEVELEEALTIQQRRQRALTMRRYKAKIAAARKRMAKRIATKEKLKSRARKKAIQIIRSKVAGEKGKSYNELSYAEKSMIDTKVQKRKAAVERIAKRLLPKMAKLDRARIAGKRLNEEFESFMEECEAPKKPRYHEMHKKDGTVKLDRRFRAFRKAMEEGVDELRDQHKQEREDLKREHEAEMKREKMASMRKDMAKLRREEIEIEDDLELLSIVEEIFKSVTLEEEKSIAALKDKAKESGIAYSILKDVFDRGMGAYERSHRPGTTPQQWAFARVNSFISGGKTRTTADADLWKRHKGKNEEVELDSFFDLNEQFELMEAGMLDKALAAIHKHVTAGADLSDISYQVSRARGVTHSGRELERAYKEKHGDPHARKSNPEVRDRLKKKYGFKEEGGAGERGTQKLTNKYKKDTPGECINEAFEALFEEVELEEGVNDPSIFKAVFLAGGPGSGKSFIVGKTALTSLGFKVVNSDELFEAGLKKAGMDMTPENIYSPKGQEIRGRAKQLTKNKQQMYLNGRLGLVIDGTGKDYDKIEKQAIALSKLGYDIAMIFVNTDEDTALKRNQMRARSLPDDTVSKMWKDVQKNLGKFQAFFGNFYLIDNSEGSDYERQTMGVYRKLSSWAKKLPTNKAVTSWVKSQRNLNEEFEALFEEKSTCDLVTAQQMKAFEKFVDRMFEKYDIDFEFTKHFGERMSDSRNKPCIQMKELADLIKKIYARQGKNLKNEAGAEAVIKDMQSDLNIPVVVKYDQKNDEFDVVAKTIMRKKNFATPNKVITYK